MQPAASTKLDICEFIEETHEYRRNGIVLPSVTQVINEVLPRTDNAPPDAIEQARLRGEWVDKSVEEYLRTGTVTFYPDSTPDKWKIALDQAIEWFDREYPNAKIECQVRLFGQQEAGSADVVIDGDLLLDLKCTYDISKTVPVQLGGYRQLFREMTGDNVIGCIGVLHCHHRLKKAVFKPYHLIDSTNDWYLVRDVHRRFFRKKAK